MKIKMLWKLYKLTLGARMNLITAGRVWVPHHVMLPPFIIPCPHHICIHHTRIRLPALAFKPCHLSRFWAENQNQPPMKIQILTINTKWRRKNFSFPFMVPPPSRTDLCVLIPTSRNETDLNRTTTIVICSTTFWMLMAQCHWNYQISGCGILLMNLFINSSRSASIETNWRINLITKFDEWRNHHIFWRPLFRLCESCPCQHRNLLPEPHLHVNETNIVAMGTICLHVAW